MKLKGNITVTKGPLEVETTGNPDPQVRVTIPYTFSGVDLSEFVPDIEDDGISQPEDLLAGAADVAIEDAKEAIRKHVEGFYGKLQQSPIEIANSKDFIGTDCDVSIFSVSSPEDLKSCSIDIEIRCYYDVDVNELGDTIEAVKDSMLGK